MSYINSEIGTAFYLPTALISLSSPLSPSPHLSPCFPLFPPPFCSGFLLYTSTPPPTTPPFLTRPHPLTPLLLLLPLWPLSPPPYLPYAFLPSPSPDAFLPLPLIVVNLVYTLTRHTIRV